MNLNRINALETVANRNEYEINFVEQPNKPISEYYGDYVFNDDSMKKYLPEDAYINVKAAIQSGTKLNRETASTVAAAMKQWAMEMGATHYAHWFQPLTGKTAEKHDSFFTLSKEGQAIEKFDGSELAQQEPDGSSFPGGGLRSTFEARGYTAWDPSSPAFILVVEEGKTLCIPTIFVTYGGEALDYKLPLLKSQTYVEDAALDVCNYFDMNATKVITTLGWEQEYFLIDEALYNARPDLVLCGRTLVGKPSPKGQQLDDHYFGSIPERVYAFMRDMEIECHKLSIPVRTRHNEVGPGQYEVAPMFEEVNVAVDHNQLMTDIMDRVAKRHRMRILLHEKPFSGVNGSGKHNNWSMSTNTGVNLLSPGRNPGKNLRFLTFFVNTIKAVYEHADLLRASVASAGNDHRLGANEAPPAIISVFIGEALTNVLNDIENGSGDSLGDVQYALDLLKKIPDLEKDNTDRNRTSPFAFTGNKFEIRMVGSDMNCAAPMTIMNTIVGNQLKHFKQEVDKNIENGMDQDAALLSVIRDYIVSSKAIRFEGDNYSEEWRIEAEKRGLSNFPRTPRALTAYKSEKSKDLFLEAGVLSERELEAHYEVKVENYVISLQIESTTLAELCYNHIIPVALEYMTEVAQNVKSLKDLGWTEKDMRAQTSLLEELKTCVNGLEYCVTEINKHRRLADSLEHAADTAEMYCTTIRDLMDEATGYANRLEYVVSDQRWPLVKYREMMFLR